MECLVKIYDKEQINNLLVIFAFRPKKVVLLYDSLKTNLNTLKFIENACKTKIPYISFEYISIDNKNLESVFSICKNIISKNENCYFDITGSKEIIAIGTYLSCLKTFNPIFKIDIENSELISIYGCKILEGKFASPKLSLETLLASHGATITGQGHPSPPKEIHNTILSFCNYIFDNTKRWKELCLYLQVGCTKKYQSANPLLFYAPKTIDLSSQSIYLKNANLLHIAEEMNLIHSLNITNEFVSFTFRNKFIKKYFTDYGTWLELYTYILISREKEFHDVQMSVKINWEGQTNPADEVINEIDVTFFANSHPVFLSCKLPEPTSEALHELSIYPHYFGGEYSKSILVSLSTIKKDHSSIFKRAHDMNISIIDGSHIKNNTFIDAIKKAIR